MRASAVSFLRKAALPLALLLVGAACEGPPGPTGPAGQSGQPGATGSSGPQGNPGTPGRNTVLTQPGVKLVIQSAAVASDGTATATIKITDGAGTPLDLNGQYTDGKVSVSFIIAALAQNPDGSPGQYTAYTTKPQTSPITGKTAVQASTDSGGTFEEIGVGQGTYRYTFGTVLKSVDRSLTHTVGAYATRTVDGVEHVANATYNFVPDGSPVTTTRDEVATATCDNCHGTLSAHGGLRRDVKLCILCHTPQSTDPDTGNTVDFKIMIHKIHMGEQLPSVIDGTPYQIIGYKQSVHDFSTVAFPQEINNCKACHTGAAHSDLYLMRPSKKTCTSCHDNVSFVDPPPAGKVLHSGGAQPDNAPCAYCHPPSGSLAGIQDVHTTPLLDPTSPTVDLKIVSIDNTAPGDAPVLTFQVKVSGSPRDILTNPLDDLTATVAGPNSDYASSWQAGIQGRSAAGTLTAVDANTGTFSYQFPASAAIPEDASGSYTVGMEGYLRPNGTEFAAFSPTMPFAVTADKPVARRQVVASDKCNKCHRDLAEHGGFRKNPQYCVLCHNPNKVNDERAPRFEDKQELVQSVDFKVMIHKIHMGENLTQSYVLGGYPPPSTDNPGGTPAEFDDVRFPGVISDCTTCHAGKTYQLPLAQSVLPSTLEVRSCTEDPSADPDNYCEDQFLKVDQVIKRPPATAVCTSCHDSASTLAHAETMTTSMGVESCATCHGPGQVFDADNYHQLSQ